MPFKLWTLIVQLLYYTERVKGLWVPREPVNEVKFREFFRYRALGTDPGPPTIVQREEPLNRTISERVDWRHTLGPVRDQGKCGSCWAFATLAGMEAAVYNDTGRVQDLSEQQMVECSVANRGCRGGFIEPTLTFLRNTGVCNESRYGYVAPLFRVPLRQVPANCARLKTECTRAFRMGQVVGSVGELQLQAMVARGPVIVVLHVNAWFYAYGAGVFDGPCTGRANHAAVLVGYNTTANGVQFWLLRNSWGSHWGEQGYIRLIRGKQQCGLGQYRAYQIRSVK